MIRIKYHVPGTPPATLFSHAEGDVSPSVITLIQYDSETFFEGQFETFEDLMQRFDPSRVIPLTFLAGVYGMNFNTEHPLNMPELNWPFGYLLCLGVMACIGTGMVIFFKRKNWL